MYKWNKRTKDFCLVDVFQIVSRFISKKNRELNYQSSKNIFPLLYEQRLKVKNVYSYIDL